MFLCHPKQCLPQSKHVHYVFCIAAITYAVTTHGSTSKATYTVSRKKQCCRTFAITLPNLNRSSKFFYDWKEDKISNKTYIKIPTNHKYVATLPCKIQTFETQTFETDINCRNYNKLLSY